MVYTFVQLSRQHRHDIVRAIRKSQDIEKCRIITKKKEKKRDMTGRKSMHIEQNTKDQEKI
jgi:hypothetical protein